ncbi:hypothetical protein [Chitinophaga sp. Cy-1792]|uniref:hypothetical protein n=1 Tax=Chitinophaga sp. Cy-1792 TaxID=2608339 RepID=UPI001422E72E|nr:hypothetical protein [Chitinophaga sp. Cy-1792]NIG56003.1 hypothetical protein [Chitinophaga sp. Cy-1792]
MEFDSNKYIENTKYLFELNKNLLTGMFVLGYALERKEGTKRLISPNWINNPIKDEWKSQWDETMFLHVKMGTEDSSLNRSAEERYLPLNGILFSLKQLETVVKMELPDWAMFYLLGETLARYNNTEISTSEFRYFISLLPLEFVHKYLSLIIKMLETYKERFTVVKVEIIDGQVCPTIK